MQHRYIELFMDSPSNDRGGYGGGGNGYSRSKMLLYT